MHVCVCVSKSVQNILVNKYVECSMISDDEIQNKCVFILYICVNLCMCYENGNECSSLCVSATLLLHDTSNELIT